MEAGSAEILYLKLRILVFRKPLPEEQSSSNPLTSARGIDFHGPQQSLVLMKKYSILLADVGHFNPQIQEVIGV